MSWAIFKDTGIQKFNSQGIIPSFYILNTLPQQIKRANET